MQPSVCRNTSDVRAWLASRGLAVPPPRALVARHMASQDSITCEPAAGCRVLHFGTDRRLCQSDAATIGAVVLARVLGTEPSQWLVRRFVADWRPELGQWSATRQDVAAWAAKQVIR